ncbi:helix-turn-helix transcriptional regulator [Actinoplanes sp. NPDC051861]|uniref:helix-turn-helix domain-containing protein n=1 Tax=Actinoplanes sp. NPDC051861 TaxID=3155170 RepID=UPI00342E6D36
MATSTIHQAREALGVRLRDLRRDAGLTGRGLAALAGWDNSKVSKIEYGKQAPSESDIRAWCLACGVPEQCEDLVVVARDIESSYVEWRRRLRTGTRARQEKSQTLEADTQFMRWFEPVLVPGLLHTAEYAAAVLRRVTEFYEVPNDVDAGVSARMERQQVLYRRGHSFHFVIAQQALRTAVGNIDVMAGQLDRLMSVMSMGRVRLGIIPDSAPYVVPSNQFIMFDDRLVHVEAVSAELTITQPREIALYARAFSALAGQAAYGDKARGLILDELRRLQA